MQLTIHTLDTAIETAKTLLAHHYGVTPEDVELDYDAALSGERPLHEQINEIAAEFNMIRLDRAHFAKPCLSDFDEHRAMPKLALGLDPYEIVDYIDTGSIMASFVRLLDNEDAVNDHLHSFDVPNDWAVGGFLRIAIQAGVVLGELLDFPAWRDDEARSPGVFSYEFLEVGPTEKWPKLTLPRYLLGRIPGPVWYEICGNNKVLAHEEMARIVTDWLTLRDLPIKKEA